MDRPDGLLEGEELLDLLSVRYSAGMQTHVDSAPSKSLYRPMMVQRHSYARWSRRSSATGFPVAGPEMVLGITAERLVVWRPGLIRSTPRRYAGAVPLARIQSAGVHRRVFASVLTLLLEQGSIVGVETMRSKRLREFASHIPAYRDYRAR
jgi:hypothetical protein